MKRCFVCFKEFDSEYNVCPHCGSVENSEPNEPIHLTPGTVLANRYIIGQSVGAGGFGIVYRAWDTKLETIVAVKEFFVSRLVTRAEGLKNLIVTKKSQEEYLYRKERFLAEARTMAKFGNHRSIPNVFEFFEENNTAYIIMELLNGMPLNHYLKQNNGSIDIDFALMIANEVGNALKSLHEKNIVHRDVAPDNIYICSGKEIRIKLMDLGAAKLADSTDDVVDIILKPGYSPTEQYDNSKNIGPWTDIYALGATMYIMLTGVKPDESTNRKIQDEVVYPKEINEQLSENLSNTIMKAMAIEKHLRFKNATEFLAAINGERKIIPLAKEKKRRSYKRFIGIAMACVIMMVGSVMVYNKYMQKQKEEGLLPADITVWFSVKEGSKEEEAMKKIEEDFESKFNGVTIDLVAISENEYSVKIVEAIETGKLPTLFESSGLSQDILKKAKNLENVINSVQFDNALFLEQYKKFYNNKKQVPLAIEVPMAFVITNGATSIDYSDKYFSDISDFGNETRIAADEKCAELIIKNFGYKEYLNRTTFFDTSANLSPVILTSSMMINEAKSTLSEYEKTYVVYKADEIYCNFIYEWSIGDGSENQIAAGERLLSWMLGNVYQSYLMTGVCVDGHIPVNPTAFETKIRTKELTAIEEVYEDFVFRRED